MTPIRPFIHAFNRSIFKLVLIPVVLFGISCDDEANLIPSYIRVNDVRLVANPSSQHLHGSLSHQITDIWVYVTDQTKQEFIGAFEIPATLPILKEGPHTLTIRAGIKVNGISETRGEYPFYEKYEKQVNLVRDSVLEVHPEFMYADFCEFLWVEDFEDGTASFVPSSRSDTIMMVTSAPGFVFEGDRSGQVSLDDSRFFFECFSSEAFDIPRQGTEVYLEMNFRTNNEMVTGLLANLSTQSVLSPVVVLNETSEWKKIYINLKNAVNINSQAITYNVFLSASKSGSVEESLILVDNLKLIHK